MEARSTAIREGLSRGKHRFFVLRARSIDVSPARGAWLCRRLIDVATSMHFFGVMARASARDDDGDE